MNEQIKYKIEKLEEEKRKIIFKHENVIDKINKCLKLLQYCEINNEDSLETIVFKKYLILENVTKVANEINEMGFRVKTNTYVGERKYKGTDISDILVNRNANVEEELKDVVQELQAINSELAMKIWN